MDSPVLKIIGILIWGTLWFFPIFIAKQLKKTQFRDHCMRLCCRGLLRIMSIRVTVQGRPSTARPLLLVSNHLNYFDIPILTSSIPLRFTPKSEIERWPLIGTICKITDCVFVERKPGKVKETAKTMHDTLARGEVISIFPESTTGNGVHVLPFKSGFFSLAEEDFGGQPLTVQPAAMTYTRVCNLPVDSQMWHKIAWYGDMDMLPHLWDFLKMGPMHVMLQFLEPVNIRQFEDRKALALHCQQVITSAIERIRENQQVEPAQNKLASSVPLFKLRSKS